MVTTSLPATSNPAIIHSEFIFENSPTLSCHATTITECRDGSLLAAWFGGTAEGKPDVGIWSSHYTNSAWSSPSELANGIQTDGTRHPCWNPVLFQPREGPLLLFYKVGPSPSSWWGLLRTSADSGSDWSEAKTIPSPFQGPIKNKPVQLSDGVILSGSSLEGINSAPSWQIHFERSMDNGKSWEFVKVTQPETSPASIQPSILLLGGDRLLSLGRTRSGKLFSTTSEDSGLSWSPLTLIDLPNPNSGTDAVTLKDGTHLLVYNHTSKGRSPLNLAMSKDGKTWAAALVLEDEPKAEFSYPAIIQTSDGLVHVTYTWKRKLVKHVILDPTKLEPRAIVDGNWPIAR